MRFQIEFLRNTTKENGEEVIVRRNSGQFASERDVEIYGLTRGPEGASGFRILKDGIVKKSVTISN